MTLNMSFINWKGAIELRAGLLAGISQIDARRAWADYGVFSAGFPGSSPHITARYFTVCDRWFSSVPGPTWTNRFFVHSGTSLGRVKMPQDAEDSLRDPLLYYGYNQDTIYDRLNEQNISWRIYHGDIPQSMVLEHQWTPRNATHYEFMGVFFTDVQAQEQHFPAFSFIEPSYYPPGQNNDHPPHTTVRAQALLANVYKRAAT